MRPSRLVLYLLLVLAKRLSASVRPSPAPTPSLPLAAAMGHLSSVKSALVVHGVIPAVLEGKHADNNGKTQFRNRTAVVSSKGELWPNRTVSSGKSAFWPNQTLSSGKSATWSNRSVGSIKSPFWDSDPAFFPHPTLRKYADSVVPFYRVRSDLQKPPTRTVTLLGLFELSTAEGDRPEGRSELAAALLAIKHVNQRKVLGDYQMRIITNDTKCDVGVGVDTYFHALYTQREMRMPALLGTGCSQVTESLAKITPYWNMVQVSFGSTSPALSDRREFPLFYRTAAPDSAHNPARLALVTRFGWETVTALSQNEDDYTLAVNDLVTQLEQANITCRATLTFAETDFNEQLNRLKAHRLGMYGPDYVWILHGSPGDQWWRGAQDGGCTPAKMAAAVEGLIIVSSHNTIIGDRPSVSGLRNDRFVTSLPLPRSQFVHQAYDAVWAVALAMRDSGLDLGRFEYADRAAARRLFHALANVSFFGISGPVSFNGADRVGVSAFHRVQGGKVVRVALYDPTTGALDFSCSGCSPIAWRQVPIAKRVFKLRVVTIRPVAFLVVASLATVGIALACTFLAFNLYFRRLKFIKLSSPRLNNMAVVGCILVYTAVILLGLDHATLPSHDAFPTVCTARVYLLSAGFSLAFGSMFTKTYRVHRIFTRSASGVVKNKLLQDTQLISLICALLVIDGLIVTLWVTVDPMQRQLRNLTLEISATDRSVVYQPQVEVCGSQFTHSWLGALYAYKGLLLIVGVYMAWETRHVKIPALNDSQYIGLSVYSVVITSALVVVLANLISERATLAFVTITSLIMGSTTASLCLLFLPKIHTILHSRDNAADPVTHSMGLKIECNTRRFLIDDHREVYYRVEVQNRVYRREIVALDNEITKLEKALSSDPSLASSSHSSVVSRKEEVPPATRGPLPPTSVGGTLPMLLLSVLPPVIPRASWPSAEHCLLNHGLTFSSEPHLEEMAVDAMEAGELGEGGEAKPSVLGRLLHMLGPSRKTSTVSMVAGGGGGGIAAALRVHVGYITGLVPSDQSRSGSLDSSSNNSRYCVKRSREELFSRRVSEDESRSAQSLQHGHNQRVSFSVTQQSSQPALRVRGSPRFPHRIVPTCSLDALEASGRQPAPVRAGKCRSLEDATVISAVEPSC